MLPFMGLDRECISSLEMATSPSCSFSLGEIASIFLSSLADSEPASSLLLSEDLCCALPFASATHPCLMQTAPYFSWQSISTWPSPDPHPEPPSPYSNNPVTKRPVSNKIGSHHYQVHQAPLFQISSFVGNTMLSLHVCLLPLILSAASHQLCGLLQGWSHCMDNLFVLFYSWFIQIYTNLVATMPSCTILFPNSGDFHYKHGGLHLFPILFTSKRMGGPLSS